MSAGVLERYTSGRLGLEGDIVIAKDTAGTGNKLLDAILAAVGEGEAIGDLVKKITHEIPEIQEDAMQLLITRHH